MPSIIGSIPDNEITPILDYLRQARQAGLKLSTDELLMCLLLSTLGVEA